MDKPRLLIIEDDEGIRTQLKYALRADFEVSTAADRPAALSVLDDVRPAVVTLDLGLPPSPDTAEEGLKALDDILRMRPATKVIVVTGNGERQNALTAVQLGAFDFPSKPVDTTAFRTVLQRAVYLHGVEAEVEQNAETVESASSFEDIIGATPRLREIYAMVTRVSKTDATVLIQGESGTGKELLAQAIHAKSVRRKHPFVAINCGAIPETLLESELFGHEKGAYTGAHIQRKGKLEVADGGTLFLDEIGEMSLPLQVKLLRFLQHREIERIGGREQIKVDVRVIAATNKNLKAEIEASRFREDLYYRLSVIGIDLPPLRERGGDIILLAKAFLRRNSKDRRRKLRFSPAALSAMLAYQWPGNVRELENKVQRGVIMAQGSFVEPRDLDLQPAQLPDENASLREARGRAEYQSVSESLVKHRGNISQAAKELAVSRPTFHALLAKHHINAKDYR